MKLKCISFPFKQVGNIFFKEFFVSGIKKEGIEYINTKSTGASGNSLASSKTGVLNTEFFLKILGFKSRKQKFWTAIYILFISDFLDYGF